MELDDPRLDTATRQLFLEVVSQMLVADFQVTLEEDTFYTRLGDRLGLTPEQRDEVMRRVNIGHPIEQRIGEIRTDFTAGIKNVFCRGIVRPAWIHPAVRNQRDENKQ